MTIHYLSQTDTLNDFRFICKKMASLLRSKDLRGGHVPMRQLTEKVHEGNCTVYELEQWYPRATKRLRRVK